MQHQSARRTATLAESHTETTEILMPDDTNNLGRALGGSVLHWMDICGAIAARRFSRRQVVTASMDHVDFLAPIDLGDVVVTEAYVFETGESSMEAKVDVYAERPSDDDERRETATSFFTFVALDDDEEAASVPELRCPTDEQREKRERALEERARRRAELAEQD